MRNTSSGQIALGGVLAALAIVIMCLGGLIPVATYVCPMLCAILLQLVLNICGMRIAWAWYGAVCILGLLMSPDKEAAVTFLFLGYYPVVKPGLDSKKLSWMWKLLLFNCSVGVMYWLLLNWIGVAELVDEFRGMGWAMAGILLLLGNTAFFLLDKVLEKEFFRKLGTSGK